jgi:hypothetical protein
LLGLQGYLCGDRPQDRQPHEVGTLIGQRVFGLALSYEDLIDHDQLRHDRWW